MGLFDPDDATLTAAAAALATLADRRLLPEIEQALARVDDAVVRTALLARLAEFGREEPTVARLVANLTPSATPPSLPMPWSGPWHEPAFAGQDRASIEAELDRREAFLRTTPNDDAARLGLATAQAAFANVLIEERGRGIDFWFEDSRRNAARVQDAKLQQEAQALLAHVAYMTGDTEGARRATAAAQAASAGARAPDPWLASRLLELVVLATVNGVYADPEAAQQRNLRPEIDRVSAALDLLLARGRPADKPALAGIGLLEFAGLRREPRLLLDRLVTLLPKSADVHERWRGRMLADLGADPMRQRSAGLADAAADQPTAQWFAGYAALIAAERHMQDHRPDAARSAYDAAIERLGRAAGDDEAMAVSAHHFAVLAHAGRAHLRFAAGDASGAVDDLVRAAALRPESLDESDGLLRKPRAMAARIAEALTAQGQAELAARLQPILR